MPLTWILLLLLSAALGWLASVILHADQARSVLLLIGLSMAGAVLGALLLTPVLAGPVEPFGFSLPALLLSLLGSFILLGIAAVAGRRQFR